jgi:DNA-binding NarL/FixJ family response regulator
MIEANRSKLIIVDDHAIVRQGLRMLLDAQAHLQVVGEAGDAASALDLIRAHQPDLILLDLIMPGQDAIAAIPEMLKAQPSLKVLVLTSSIDEKKVRGALEAGAQGYILKASRPADLLRAIDALLHDRPALDPAANQLLIDGLRRADPLDTLTAREREVFMALARGLNNTEIAAQFTISEGTVRTHVAVVLEKLMLRNRVQAALYAVKRGLVRSDDLP